MFSFSGAITLEIKNVNKDSAGEYKCYAENEHGAAVKVVTFDLAGKLSLYHTIPTFIDLRRRHLENIVGKGENSN